MNVKTKIIILTICATIVSQLCGMSKSNRVNVKIRNYKGWEESVEIDNGCLKIVVVPSIGRIMYFGLSDGENLLWNNERFLGENVKYTDKLLNKHYWANYGGDKVWNMEQRNFPEVLGRGWPPDEYFDGGRYEYDLLENGVQITSQVSEYTNTFLTREITTTPGSKQVNIAQTITCARKHSVVPATFWNVTQAKPPLKYIIDRNQNSKFKGNLKYFMEKFDPDMEILDGNMIIENIENDTVKIGSDSKEFLAAVYDDKIFVQSFQYEENKKYPDDGCTIEIFINPRFVELELLSYLKMMEEGESLNYNIQWSLDGLDSMDKEYLVKKVEELK